VDETIWEKNHDEPLVIAISKDDPDMKAATQEAQKSLDVFLNLYGEYKDHDGVFFAIKVPLKDGNETAHFWFTFKRIQGDHFSGEHFELPVALSCYKTVSVKRENIEDWMINDHGHLYGGYTIRVARNRLSANELEKFDEYVGITVYKENKF
jgi:uncharacterized protein YegJ (DUF2314 family)